MSGKNKENKDIEPIKPSEALAKIPKFPNVSIAVFNQLIAKYFDYDFALIMEAEALKELAKVGVKKRDFLEYNWFRDVAAIYRGVGWTVSRENHRYEINDPDDWWLLFRAKGKRLQPTVEN